MLKPKRMSSIYDQLKLFHSIMNRKALYSFSAARKADIRKLNEQVDQRQKQTFTQELKDLKQALKSNKTKETSLNLIKNGQLADSLKDRGINQLFPVQIKTYKAAYQGQDLIVSDRTGSGKTIAYSLPVIDRIITQHKKAIEKEEKINKYSKNQTLFLIMTPTRQLAKQVQKEIISLIPQGRQAKRMSVVALFGGSSISQQISQLNRGAQIIVATPGRLLDMIKNQKVNFQNLKTLCLDQADEMLQRGFQDDIQQIILHLNQCRAHNNNNEIQAHKRRKGSQEPVYQTLLFSATIPSWVLRISQDYMKANKQIFNLIQDDINDNGTSVRTSKTVQHLGLQIPNIFSQQETIQILNDLINKYANKGKGRTIIFVSTKKQAAQLSFAMENAVALHGDISQKERLFNLECFSKDHPSKGQKVVKTLIATDVAARGLDIPSVQLVIQTQPPRYSESYIHRSGRTGRMGKHGKSITLFNRNNFKDLLDIQKHAGIQIRQVCKPQGQGQQSAQQILQQILDKINGIKFDKMQQNKVEIVQQLVSNLQNDLSTPQNKSQKNLVSKIVSFFLFENKDNLARQYVSKHNTSSFINPSNQNAVTFIIKSVEQNKTINKKDLLQIFKKQLSFQAVDSIFKTIKRNGEHQDSYVFDIDKNQCQTFLKKIEEINGIKQKFIIKKAQSSDMILPTLSNHRYARYNVDSSYYNRRNNYRQKTQKPFGNSSLQFGQKRQSRRSFEQNSEYKRDDRGRQRRNRQFQRDQDSSKKRGIFENL